MGRPLASPTGCALRDTQPMVLPMRLAVGRVPPTKQDHETANGTLRILWHSLLDDTIGGTQPMGLAMRSPITAVPPLAHLIALAMARNFPMK